MNCFPQAAALPAVLRRLLVLSALAVVIGAVPATEPSGPQYASSAHSGQVSIEGTSTLHDWTVKGSTLIGKMVVEGEWNPDATNVQVKSIDLTIPVNSLKSSEGGGMDNTTYDALKSKQNPNITFQLTNATLKAPPSKNNPDYHFDAVGQLTVAGGKRTLDLNLSVLRGGDGSLTITTQTPLKMTDFGISPPTAMLGMIKSGDDVTVKVTWRVEPKAQ